MSKLLYWLPRLLSIAFILFVSLFALDALNEGSAVSFLTHLIPSGILILVLIVAWRYEWVGALCFAGGAAHYLWKVLPRTDLSVLVKLNWVGVIAAPALLIAALFWAGWLQKSRPAIQ